MTQSDEKREKPDSCLVLAPEELDCLERELTGDPDAGQLSPEMSELLDAVDVAPVDPPKIDEKRARQLEKKREAMERLRRSRGMAKRKTAMSAKERQQRGIEAQKRYRKRLADKRDAAREREPTEITSTSPYRGRTRREAAIEREARLAPIRQESARQARAAERKARDTRIFELLNRANNRSKPVDELHPQSVIGSVALPQS